jgi:S1-C subfamily serine protease
VLYNPNRDIAVLHVPGLTAAPLKFDYSGQYGASAIVAGYPLDHSFTAVAARIGHSETAVGENIYSTAQVQRQIYPVRAVVEHGNSGGPLLAPDGRVYGMVFAASTTDPDTGYALTASEVKPAVQAGVGRTQPVPTQSCVTP